MAIGMKLRCSTRSSGRRSVWLSFAKRPTVRKERNIITAVVRKIPFLRIFFCYLTDILLEVKILPAVFVKKVEGAYGTEDFGETGE